MKTSIKGLADIVQHEAIVLSPYKDSVGVWTVGIGHTRWDGDPVPDIMPRGQDVPLDEIFEMFKHSIEKYEKDVDKAIIVDLKQHEFDALVSFHYNTGAIARATLTKLINNKAPTKDVVASMMLWIKQKELTSRRKKEAQLYSNGIYSNTEGLATIYDANIKGNVMWSTGRQIAILTYLEND